MARKATGWTCQKTTKGNKCKTHNPPRSRKCLKCGKPRPPKKKPAHMSALDIPYAEYIKLNGGEFCGVCGCLPTPGRRLNRDHDHITSKPRGLLCTSHNRFLVAHRYGLVVTPELLERAAAYLRRTTSR